MARAIVTSIMQQLLETNFLNGASLLKFPQSLKNGTMGPVRASLFLGLILSGSVFAANLKFDQVFSDKGEPKNINYEVTYKSVTGEHHLEVWREGNTRLKRKTDDALELYIIKDQNGPEFNLSILDLKKKIYTQIKRTNLYRIGSFTDWYDLAHGLKHPLAAYEINKLSVAPSKSTPVSSCKWYELIQGENKTQICWSSDYKIPLMMTSLKGDIFWNVKKVNINKMVPSVFEIHSEGFIKNDANRDIEPD